MSHHLERIPAQGIDADGTNIFCEPADSFVGKCLDNRYDIIGLIASGGMGDVYLASQRGVGQEVAVKKLRDAYYRDASAVERFIDEARSYARIIHPNAVKLYDLLNVRGQICIVMEYVHGRTLTDYLDGGYVFSIRQILGIGMQLADALGTVHKAGIIHRDLKSQNVMLVETVGSRFSVKILDFGIAKIMDKERTQETGSHYVIGSPQYMSPEQCYGHAVDHRTDIYSFGVLMYAMICNRLPFNSSRPMELMEMQCASPVPPMRRADSSEIPQGLCALVLKCLEKEAGCRYASFAEVVIELTCIQEGGMASVEGAHDRCAADVMAAAAVAERKYAGLVESSKSFALDAHETTVTKSPNLMRCRMAMRRAGARFLDFCVRWHKFIIASLFVAIAAAAAYISLIAFAPVSDVRGGGAPDGKAAVQVVSAPDKGEGGAPAPDEGEVRHGAGSKGFTIESADTLKPAREFRRSLESTILSVAEGLNRAGKPGSAEKWLGMIDPETVEFPHNAMLAELLRQSGRYASLLDDARRALKQKECAKIEKIAQEIPPDSEGMLDEIGALLDQCVPPKKTKSKSKSASEKKKSKRSGSGFDWSSITSNNESH